MRLCIVLDLCMALLSGVMYSFAMDNVLPGESTSRLCHALCCPLQDACLFLLVFVLRSFNARVAAWRGHGVACARLLFQIRSSCLQTRMSSAEVSVTVLRQHAFRGTSSESTRRATTRGRQVQGFGGSQHGVRQVRGRQVQGFGGSQHGVRQVRGRQVRECYKWHYMSRMY